MSLSLLLLLLLLMLLLLHFPPLRFSQLLCLFSLVCNELLLFGGEAKVASTIAVSLIRRGQVRASLRGDVHSRVLVKISRCIPQARFTSGDSQGLVLGVVGAITSLMHTCR